MAVDVFGKKGLLNGNAGIKNVRSDINAGRGGNGFPLRRSCKCPFVLNCV